MINDQWLVIVIVIVIDLLLYIISPSFFLNLIIYHEIMTKGLRLEISIFGWTIYIWMILPVRYGLNFEGQNCNFSCAKL